MELLNSLGTWRHIIYRSRVNDEYYLIPNTELKRILEVQEGLEKSCTGNTEVVTARVLIKIRWEYLDTGIDKKVYIKDLTDYWK